MNFRDEDIDEDETIDPYDDAIYDVSNDDDYYSQPFDDFGKPNDERNIETFDYKCSTSTEIHDVINQAVTKIIGTVPISHAAAKILLINFKWDIDEIIRMSNKDFRRLLVVAQLETDDSCRTESETSPSAKYFTVNDENLNFIEENADSPVEYTFCPICLASAGTKSFLFLRCRHKFCKFCWRMHIRFQMDVGCSSRIECMNSTCHLIAPEDLILDVLQTSPYLLTRYLKLSFQDLVQSNPCLRYCPGPDCTRIIYANRPRPRRVLCEECQSCYCFLCGLSYHAPADCDTIRKWLTKCADDSETANYLTANTKDCPHCGVCIEKSGGCNHMACSKCKYHFCWVCMGDWKNHGSQYYECSKYKENPNVANESMNSTARKALEKYLFYYERWENHQKSLKMEETMMSKIKAKIDDKVNRHDGTWIDWQYLYDAAALLTKCRYTLQYTYPFAYYAPNDNDKPLFEYQQSQLEIEIENLAWKVEHDEETKRAVISECGVSESSILFLLAASFHVFE